MVLAPNVTFGHANCLAWEQGRKMMKMEKEKERRALPGMFESGRGAEKERVGVSVIAERKKWED